MRNNIIVNFLLACVFVTVLLHQWVGWKAEGHEIKNESLAFEKTKCLAQLNAYGKRRTPANTPCHKLYLRDSQGEPTADLFEFCIPPSTNYLTAEMGRACGMERFWIRDRKGCMKTFAPIDDEKVLRNLMTTVGFAECVPFVLVQNGRVLRYRLVFFSDSCVVDKKGKILKCENEDVDPDIYPLSPELIPRLLYVKHSGCSVD